MTQETTVQTASLGAEVSAGGPHLNLIPREGGNRYSGATDLGSLGLKQKRKAGLVSKAK